MTDRLAFLWPEIALFITTCVVMIVGLSKSLAVRKSTGVIAGVGVLISLYLAAVTTPHTGGAAICPLTKIEFAPQLTASMGQVLLPDMVPFAKCLIAAVGLLLLLVLGGTVDRNEEAQIASGKRTYDPLRANRAEFYAFYLFSLTGLMLTASADDLIWLFLALELTSLPTYIMVAMSTSRNQAREAGVKYFFLGALGAAIFLYGFALIYGGTGETKLNDIAAVIHAQGLNSLTLTGVFLALLGFMFKIAAVPMHFYTADVYQGAASQVSAFLAFVPKTAGFLAILLVCATVGWAYEPAVGKGGELGFTAILTQTEAGTRLPESIRLLLWVIAALTMTIGNIFAVLQTSVKRTLAYSSIAHSGYMLVGVIAGPFNGGEGGSFTTNGVGAVLFYLLSYGVMNLGTFAALAMVERTPKGDGEAREIDHFDDIRGLCKVHPIAGWTMVISSLSLLGLPPLLGFFGKLPLFTSGIAAGEITLVVILGLNSAIAAFYYLRLAFLPLTDARDATIEQTVESPVFSRKIGGLLSAGGVIVLAIAASMLIEQVNRAGVVRTWTPAMAGESDKHEKPHASLNGSAGPLVSAADAAHEDR
ncbi:MAG: NADH-quinone oxidoreductase subunit N [Phycisphaerae bacterium]|jgi:NADH-quinone oxidoreductase subunit N